MGDKGNRYSPRLKAEVALSAYRNNRLLSELSAEYGVSSMQIGRWKKPLSDRAAELFETRSSMDLEKITDPLYKEIERLKDGTGRSGARPLDEQAPSGAQGIPVSAPWS